MRATRVLVVDDEPGMLRAIERVLGDSHELVVCGSSSEALGFAVDFKPDLAILDIRMPGLDGFELMARLKSIQPDLDVILMTGSLEDQDEKLVRAIRGRAFYFIQKPFDRDVLKTLVERCLELRSHRDANRKHLQRIETELAAARAFQQALLPPPQATIGKLTVDCRYSPCSELGGDLYDYASDATERVALLIADVSGHGASAAMLTSVVKSGFRASHVDDYEPLAVVERVSSGVAAFGHDRFITLIAAIVAPTEGWLAYVNAGHPAGLVWNRDRRLERLEGTGPLVSPALPASRWERAVTPIGPGDRVLLFTDGVSESLIFDGDTTGEARLKAAIQQNPIGGSPLLDAILADVTAHHRHHPHRDDLTLVTATID